MKFYNADNGQWQQNSQKFKLCPSDLFERVVKAFFWPKFPQNHWKRRSLQYCGVLEGSGWWMGRWLKRQLLPIWTSQTVGQPDPHGIIPHHHSYHHHQLKVSLSSVIRGLYHPCLFAFLDCVCALRVVVCQTKDAAFTTAFPCKTLLILNADTR